MKKLTALFMMVFCWCSAYAQLNPPSQTDVYVVKSVVYDMVEIRPENWPCTEIVKSGVDFRFADQTFPIVESYNLLEAMVYKLSSADGETSELLFYPNRSTVKICFSGYIFKCELKEVVSDSAPEVPEKSEEAVPFQLVDVKPSFQGGDSNAFLQWVNSNLTYPEIAKRNGVQGRVTLQFTVETDGSVGRVKVLRGSDPALDKEAVRVVSMSPKWTPGFIHGKPVPVTYTFPVVFHL